MMSSFQQTIGNIAQSVSNTVNTALGNNQSPPALSHSDVKNLEETERTRRLEHVSQTRINKQNAANVSSLIRTQSFPVFKGNVSKGYKRVTIKYEEEERRRRLTNKSESALRRTNANKTARMIQKCGWPLYGGRAGGAEYIMMDPTKLLEEEERAWRTNDSYWTTTAKHNAATVANIMRWNSFHKNPKSGYRRHTRFLEEKERRNRLAPEAMQSGMDNAYNQAKLIRQMGAPFYIQTPSAKRDFSLNLHKVEEQERERRIKDSTTEKQLARELAGIVPTKSLTKDTDLEEQERGRRMKDLNAQKLAKENAKHVSLMVRESSSNKINGTAPMWFSISRNSMKALEEIERTRRMRDVDGQDLARQNARKVSDIVLHKWSLPPKRNLNTIEEEERQSRILDRAQQSIAVKNARKVSGLIAKHNLLSSNSKSFTLAEEESERARRLQDAEQQRLAKNNAKKVSSLVSSLNVAPGRHVATTGDAPLSPAKLSSIPPVENLPTYHAPSASPITVNMPFVASSPLQKSASTSDAVAAPYQKVVASPLPSPLPLETRFESPLIAAPSVARSSVQSPLVAAAPVARSASSSAIPRSAPISSAPLSSAPLSATPIAAAPVPLSSAPILSAPISAAPVTRAAPISAAPISAAPISAAPISAAPISAAPISAAPISAAPATRAAPIPVSSAPTPISSAPIPISSTVPLSNSGGNFVLPSTSAPVPVAPLATAMPAMPIRQAVPVAPLATAMPTMPIRQAVPTVPVDSIAIAHPSLGERQRKKLLKQAEKHNRKSDKDVRKAEQSMLKAERFHQKGRDDKAMKLEHKAENLMKAAEHEKRWATGLQGEIAPNAPAPASM